MTVTIVQPRAALEDPHNCTDAADALTVLEAVYDPLLRRTADGFGPALATAWETPDGREWTITLREGVRFHDGAPCDAVAVAATLRRMARPEMGVTLGAPGVWAQYLGGMELEAPDDRTLRLRLAAPMADLPDILCHAYVASPASLEDPAARPSGTGPYRIEQVAPERIAASAADGHFDGPPPNPRLEWRAVPDAAARLAMFEAGEAQVATRLPAGASGPDIREDMPPTTLIYLFNAARGPLADARVRRALNLALDREALVRDVLGGAGVPLYGPFSPRHRGHVPPNRTGPDQGAARALLAEAGHGGGLTLEVDCPTALPDEAEALTAAVEAQLAPLGVRFDVRIIPDRTEYAHMVRRSEIRDMCVFDSSPLSTYRVLREKIDSRVRGSWWLGYANGQVEALIDEAARTPDTAARTALFARCHEALVADPPWLTCYCHTRRTGIRGGAPGALRDGSVLDVRALPPLAP
jgi:peptide/nickel transport system substrate-binding protein